MLQFAVCDDDPVGLERASGFISAYFSARPGLDGSVRVFQSAYDLMECVRARGGFDAYLLDVMMPHMNGIELGKAIRETGDNAPIVYLTSSPDYALDSYAVQAYTYLLKPITREAVDALMDKLTAALQTERGKPIAVRTRDGVTPVYPSHVAYVNVREHTLYYHLDGGRVVESVTIRDPFEQAVAPLLESGRFLKINFNHVINMSYVDSLAGNSFVMRDGADLPISRSGASKIKDAYMEFILERGKQP